MICTKFDWNWPAGSEEGDFKKNSVYSYSFVIISPWARAFPFIWTIYNPLLLQMICAKSGQNWPSGFEEVENIKVYRQKDGQLAIRKAHLSFQLRWAKNNWKNGDRCGHRINNGPKTGNSREFWLRHYNVWISLKRAR
jgi:hypothetical protein